MGKMTQERFAVLLPCIVKDFINMIVEEKSITEMEAAAMLYSSKLYALLEEEKTKVWYYSTPTLFSFLEQEEQTGEIDFPDV